MFPTVPEDGKTHESQDDMSDWSARDWEDYNYVPPTGGAGGGEGAPSPPPGIRWLNFVTACLDSNLQISLHVA